jgi:integrase
MKSPRLELVKRTVAAKGRRPNAAYRVREHLTESEMGRLLAALKRKRHGQRDGLIGLLIYRHGLRVSEACDLRWDDVDLNTHHHPAPAQRQRRQPPLPGAGRTRRPQGAPTRLCSEGHQVGLRIRERARSALRPYGHRSHGRAGWRDRQPSVSGSRSHVAAFDRVCLGGERNGYTPAATLPGPRQHNQHGSLHRNVARTVQGCMAPLEHAAIAHRTPL